MLYDKPVLGKVGVRSMVSKKMAFGICADNGKEARRELIKTIGYWDAQKWRWRVCQWTKEDLEKRKIEKIMRNA